MTQNIVWLLMAYTFSHSELQVSALKRPQHIHSEKAAVTIYVVNTGYFSHRFYNDLNLKIYTKLLNYCKIYHFGQVT
jgi:hypothetical protein